MRLAARIAGIGLVGPGLAGWGAARETLAGRAPYAPSPTWLAATPSHSCLRGCIVLCSGSVRFPGGWTGRSRNWPSKPVMRPHSLEERTELCMLKLFSVSSPNLNVGKHG